MGRVLCGRISPFFNGTVIMRSGREPCRQGTVEQWNKCFFSIFLSFGAFVIRQRAPFFFEFVNCLLCEQVILFSYYHFISNRLVFVMTALATLGSCIFCFSHLTKTMVVILLFLKFFFVK